MGTSSYASNENLLNAENFEDFLAVNQKHMLTQTFPEHLMLLLHQKKLKRADVVRDSGLEKAYVYQIFNGEKKPSRDKLIAIAFGLHLSTEETQRMLRLGGCSELYVRVERDALILFSIQHGKTISETDDALYKRGLDTILSWDG